MLEVFAQKQLSWNRARTQQHDVGFNNGEIINSIIILINTTIGLSVEAAVIAEEGIPRFVFLFKKNNSRFFLHLKKRKKSTDMFVYKKIHDSCFN